MAKNFGTGQRDSMRAAAAILTESRERGGISYSTVATLLSRFEKFNEFAKSEGVNRLDHIKKELVQKYSANLRTSEYSPAYQQNLLSAVNTVLTRGHERERSRWEAVSARNEGLPSRSNVRTKPTPTLDQFQAAIPAMPERAAAVAGLARALGLRSKEASLLNTQAALREAKQRGAVTISDGTKGGLSREVAITNSQQIKTLEQAAILQGIGRALIPQGKNWDQFRAQDLQAGRAALKERGINGYHDLRAAYAADRYQTLTGHAAPCNQDGQCTADQQSDYNARMQISRELGHSRIAVTVAYLGGRRCQSGLK